LLAKLEQGAEAFGFEGDVWMTKRIAQMIREAFGVSYHHDDMGPLLRSLGWRFQKPVARATLRDDLGEKLTAAYQRLASTPEIIKACFAQAGLYQSAA